MPSSTGSPGFSKWFFMALLPLHTQLSRCDGKAVLAAWSGILRGIGDSFPGVQTEWYFLSFKHITFGEKVPSL